MRAFLRSRPAPANGGMPVLAASVLKRAAEHLRPALAALPGVPSHDNAPIVVGPYGGGQVGVGPSVLIGPECPAANPAAVRPNAPHLVLVTRPESERLEPDSGTGRHLAQLRGREPGPPRRRVQRDARVRRPPPTAREDQCERDNQRHHARGGHGERPSHAQPPAVGRRARPPAGYPAPASPTI